MLSAVFPAQAGVIPIHSTQDMVLDGIPRASGGDPTGVAVLLGVAAYSPRKRG